MRSLEEILKFVDTYKNFYGIYHLYLSNNFNYCTISIITYFRAFANNISSGHGIFIYCKEITFNNVYNYIKISSGIYIYMYIYIPRFFHYRVLMIDIFYHISGTALF